MGGVLLIEPYLITNCVKNWSIFRTPFPSCAADAQRAVQCARSALIDFSCLIRCSAALWPYSIGAWGDFFRLFFAETFPHCIPGKRSKKRAAALVFGGRREVPRGEGLRPQARFGAQPSEARLLARR